MAIQRRERGGKVRWVGRYYGPDGSERSRTFETKREAKAWVDEREREKRRGEWIAPEAQQITLGDLVQTHVDRTTNPRTRASRQFAANNLGPLDGTPIGKLQRSDLRAWADSLTQRRPWVAGGKPVSESSARSVLQVVTTVLNLAVSDGLLVKSPAHRLKPPKGPSETVELSAVMTWEQIVAVRDEAKETLAAAITLGAATGLRGGELGGLRVRSIDFLRQEVHVTHQSQGRATPWAWEELKTEKANRVVPLTDAAGEALSRMLHGAGRAPGEPLFLTRQGGQYTSNTLGSAFVAARERAGLEEFTLHDLRHFYASALISAGLSARAVADLLGHENPATTLRVYAKLFPGDRERARSAIADVMRDQGGTAGSAPGGSAGIVAG
ncbi:tyrosine-type recombinase/integrase [Dietzia maris]